MAYGPGNLWYFVQVTIVVFRFLQELSVSEDKVSLSSVYPRRDFTTEMDSLTMQDLQLVPSGVMLVRIKGSVSATSVMGDHTCILSFSWTHQNHCISHITSSSSHHFITTSHHAVMHVSISL